MEWGVKSSGGRGAIATESRSIYVMDFSHPPKLNHQSTRHCASPPAFDDLHPADYFGTLGIYFSRFGC
jgi:hypothetical protein